MALKPTKGEFEKLIGQIYPKDELRWNGGFGSIHITDEGTFEQGSHVVWTPECVISLDFRYPKFKRAIMGLIGKDQAKDSMTGIVNIYISGNHRLDYHPVSEDFRKNVELMGLKIHESRIEKGNPSSIYVEYKPENFDVLDLGYAIRSIQKMEMLAMGDDFYKQTESDVWRIDSRNDRAFNEECGGEAELN